MVSETELIIDRWAGQPSGFIWSGSRGWVPVQETAQKYAFDERRFGKEKPEWEASAKRFIEAVWDSDRWCLDPDETEMLDSAFQVERAA